ncbi:hypothetical protein CERSUDRAFT_110942 [Gelatoporia subvermispora B]|uniref:Uncharacterized protein n=1 Tax=Ceriporiopsis subvermispora (strain B) TaxID=914234 RepID=M2QTH4_CERS8|nr:hypothetical protein CERSUDRAFT_110942 [Gelatoporia subvermispora B]
MPDYVYALHDFKPENPDEVPLKVGEKIEVVEKDDLYGDGWWQGRNTSGQVGLFPKVYTSPDPPSTSSAPQPLNGAPPAASAASDDTPNKSPAHASEPLQSLQEEPDSALTNESAPRTPMNRDDLTMHERQTSQGSGEVMKATLTDVQKAIEQLGRADRDGARSFSFASSQGDYSDRSERESEASADEDAEGDEAMAWHKGAREKLALRAQLANEQRMREEAEASEPPTPLRTVVPPIDVEMSDESEAEEDEDEEDDSKGPRRHSDGQQPRYPHIPEVDEEEEQEQEDTLDFAKSPPPVITTGPGNHPTQPRDSDDPHHIEPSEEFIVPSPGVDESDLPTATANKTFLEQNSAPSSIPSSTSPTIEVDEIPSEDDRSSPSKSPTPMLERAMANTSVPTSPLNPVTPGGRATEASLPFTATSTLPSPTTSTAESTVPSSAGIQQTLTPPTTVPSLKSGLGSPVKLQTESSPSEGSKKHMGDPSTWSVEDVVEWLKLKGFDQGTCDKFIEQEIAGDVLLELDQNVLKTEIGIVAFGKRVRIMNAIAELRRPPSISESQSDRQLQSPSVLVTPLSQSRSFPYTHSHSTSMQSSAPGSVMNSPMYGHHGISPIVGSVASDSPVHAGDLPTSPSKPIWRTSDPSSIAEADTEADKERTLQGLGLGLPSSPAANGKTTKSRPAQLSLSPSDGALGAKVVLDKSADLGDDERTAVSENESGQTQKTKRRGLFTRSIESGSIKDTSSRHSKDSAPPATPPATTVQEKGESDKPEVMRRHSKGKRSVDEHHHRISLFGGSFSSTLGKSRKPPPRLSAAVEKGEGGERTLSTFSRMSVKRSSSRPSTSDGVRRKDERPKESPREISSAEVKEREERERKEKDHKDPTLLRKRTTSTSDVTKRPIPVTSTSIAGGTLKSGQSILAQIGEPDHSGWMRKKGERYNTWKSRYFVLKGPHLYYLKSDSKSETKIKGYINTAGYKVTADENVDPGRYGFRIEHDTDKTHYFSSDEHLAIREWMKALMKATISRDYNSPVVSSCNIPTIPLTVAQAMNPAPRPPSPTARDATQRALRRENPSQLSSRDAQVLLMGLPAKDKSSPNQNGERARLDSFFTNDTVSTNGTEPASPKKSLPPSKSSAPPRPSREMRRMSSSQGDFQGPVDASLIEWANSHLPSSLQITDPTGPLCGGLALLRLAEDIKGKPSSPPVPDSAFPSSPNDDKLDGLFRLFDFLLDNDVKMGTVSINDIRQGKREKIVQLLRALKTWEDKRKVIAQSIGKGPLTAGPFMGLAGPVTNF